MFGFTIFYYYFSSKTSSNVTIFFFRVSLSESIRSHYDIEWNTLETPINTIVIFPHCGFMSARRVYFRTADFAHNS